MENEKHLDRLEVLSGRIVDNCKSYKESKNLNTLATLKSVVEEALKEMEEFVADF